MNLLERKSDDVITLLKTLLCFSILHGVKAQIPTVALCSHRLPTTCWTPFPASPSLSPAPHTGSLGVPWTCRCSNLRALHLLFFPPELSDPQDLPEGPLPPNLCSFRHLLSESFRGPLSETANPVPLALPCTRHLRMCLLLHLLSPSPSVSPSHDVASPSLCSQLCLAHRRLSYC